MGEKSIYLAVQHQKVLVHRLQICGGQWLMFWTTLLIDQAAKQSLWCPDGARSTEKTAEFGL